MATYKRVYKGDTTTSLNGTTLSGSEQSTGDIDLETNAYEGIQFEVSIAFHASGTEDIELRLYNKLTSTSYSSNDIPAWSQTVECDPGNTVDVSIGPLTAPCHCELTAKEAGTESNHGTITVKYDAWRYTDA